MVLPLLRPASLALQVSHCRAASSSSHPSCSSLPPSPAHPRAEILFIQINNQVLYHHPRIITKQSLSAGRSNQCLLHCRSRARRQPASKSAPAMQDGAGAKAGSIQTLLTLLADGEEQALQLGDMMAADDPWSSRAEHYRGAARRLQCTLGKAAAAARAIEAAAPGSSRGTDRSDSPRSADESSGGTTVATEVQERQSMCKRRKGLPRWTAKFRVPDASLEATPDDGFSWRKYGQKDILGAKFPRGYYRCTYRTAQACAATKQVQRSDTDLCVFDVTYQGEHTCHQKQRATVAAKSQSPPPPAPLEQQLDPSMQLLGMGFKRVLKVETAGLHDHDHGPASAPAASFPFPFPSVPPFHQAGEATDNPAAAFSPPASRYFPPQHPVVVDGSCYADIYDYEAPGARMRGAESSELGEVVTRAITAPAAFDYSSLFHHQAELDDPHLTFPPFGGPPHGPYQ